LKPQSHTGTLGEYLVSTQELDNSTPQSYSSEPVSSLTRTTQSASSKDKDNINILWSSGIEPPPLNEARERQVEILKDRISRIRDEKERLLRIQELEELEELTKREILEASRMSGWAITSSFVVMGSANFTILILVRKLSLSSTWAYAWYTNDLDSKEESDQSIRLTLFVKLRLRVQQMGKEHQNLMAERVLCLSEDTLRIKGGTLGWVISNPEAQTLLNYCLIYWLNLKESPCKIYCTPGHSLADMSFVSLTWAFANIISLNQVWRVIQIYLVRWLAPDHDLPTWGINLDGKVKKAWFLIL